MPSHLQPKPAQGHRQSARPAHLEARLYVLRQAIGSIEGRAAASSPPGGAHSREPPAREGTWTLGEPALDDLVGLEGLQIGAVHEIRPSTHTDRGGAPGAVEWAAGFAAARRFALALAARRLATAPGRQRAAPWLICAGAPHVAELGAPYGPGLAALGLEPDRLIVVEPAKPFDVLWALDEGLRSEGLALVLGEVGDVGLTPARRLALAAARSGTPCLLLTHPRADTVAATATRWRVSPAPGGAHALDAGAPGAPRLQVELERCRGSPAGASLGPLLVEWCNAAYRFRMASHLADRAPRARLPTGRLRWAVG